MRRILALILAVLVFFPTKIALAQDEAKYDFENIGLFSTEIKINQDTSLSIIETIDYFTPGSKHGIFRYIPEKYRQNGVIVSTPIRDISVTDAEGTAMPYELSRSGGNVTLKIGDPNITFSGSRVYVISYRVEDGLLRQKEGVKLLWDITGEGWSFPILRAEARVISPFAGVENVACFTGVFGGTESNCSSNQDSLRAIFNTQQQINYGDNFTVEIGLSPLNQLVFPSATTSLLRTIWNNIFWLFIPLPLVVMFWYWYRKGRDYRFAGPNVYNLDPSQPQALRPLFEPVYIPLVYQPIRELTPGQAGSLFDEKVDNSDVVAEIVELAHLKFLTIKRLNKQGILSLGHDYQLEKKDGGGQHLASHQRYLLENIFSTGDKVKLSELKGKFYPHMSKVKEMLAEDMKKKELFIGNPTTARAMGFVVMIALEVAAFIAIASSLAFLSSGWIVSLFILQGLVGLVLAWNMPQKTAVGTNLALQVKGLKRTIEVGKWREEIKEKGLFIEEILPLAIALGVIGKLVKDMAALNITPPSYASGGFAGNTLAWSGFISDFSSSASSGLSYNPSSSSYGGSSGSGGGGGGGGGGSW